MSERTKNQKWKKYAALTAALWLLCTSVPVRAEETDKNSTTSQLYARSAVLMDAENGRILLSKNGEDILPMASTTKIMTCILTLEMGGTEEIAEVSSYAAGMPKVNMSSRKGECYMVKDLLHSLMLESHNDAAAILAEHFGAGILNMRSRAGERSREESTRAVLAFVEKMNEKAREIGCENTTFVTPNGLDGILTVTGKDGSVSEVQHSSTAEDMAAILRYCIHDSEKKEEFLAVTRTGNYTFSDYKRGEDGAFHPGNRTVSCVNHNAFLQMMDGALTGKTGFTGKAGYCYVGALEQDGKVFTAALLACGWPGHKSWKWHDMKLLMEYALDAYEMEKIDTKKEVAPIALEKGREESVCVEVEEKQIELLLSDEDKTEIKWEIPKQLSAPVYKGQVIGKGLVYVNGEVYDEIAIKISNTVLEFTKMYCIKTTLRKFLL